MAIRKYWQAFHFYPNGEFSFTEINSELDDD